MTGLDVDSEEEEVHFDDSLALEGEHSDSEVLVKLSFLLKASNIATANLPFSLVCGMSFPTGTGGRKVTQVSPYFPPHNNEERPPIGREL